VEDVHPIESDLLMNRLSFFKTIGAAMAGLPLLGRGALSTSIPDAPLEKTCNYVRLEWHTKQPYPSYAICRTSSEIDNPGGPRMWTVDYETNGTSIVIRTRSPRDCSYRIFGVDKDGKTFPIPHSLYYERQWPPAS
jgi:hypothetical protein